MNIKKEYCVGDNVWIHGIDRFKNRLTKGTIIMSLNIPSHTDLHYIISIPTEIEPLLEIRTWHSISQDEFGPIGLFRGRENFQASKKYMTKLGIVVSEEGDEEYEPTAEEINAAIEKSTKVAVHQPLSLKDNKPKSRYRSRKRKQ